MLICNNFNENERNSKKYWNIIPPYDIQFLAAELSYHSVIVLPSDSNARHILNISGRNKGLQRVRHKQQRENMLLRELPTRISQPQAERLSAYSPPLFRFNSLNYLSQSSSDARRSLHRQCPTICVAVHSFCLWMGVWAWDSLSKAPKSKQQGGICLSRL